MIDHVDNMLRHLLLSRIDQLADDTQVRFQPPDADWRQHVAGLNELALNVYLIDLRENRELRSTQRMYSHIQGDVVNEPAPFRMDLHYLITAWSPALANEAVEPTVDEHALLYSAAEVLVDAEPLVPTGIYQPDPLPAGFPDSIADTELPTKLLPADGFPNYPEFWGTMGSARWRPAIYLTVTVPIARTAVRVGAHVTTGITESRQTGTREPGAVSVQIAGTVLSPTGQPVHGAWVSLETTDNKRLQAAETDALGRYRFSRLAAGLYRLRARAVGFDEEIAEIDVPATEGGYDLSFK